MSALRAKWFFIALIFAIGAAQAMAATYYVDPVGGLDTNNGTSVATAVKTITKAGTLAGPGDTVYLRGTGHFPQSTFDATNWSGTSGNVITVQSYPGETAVFDPGYADYKTVPNSEWAVCTEPGAHADEYISVDTFNTEAAYGTFLATGDRLLCYDRIEDLRATNESFVLVPVADPRPGLPVFTQQTHKYPWTYRGPGLWWDPVSKKIHFRASPTNYDTPGVTDYAGGTNPNQLAMSISKFADKAIIVEANYITFKDIVFQNGGANETISVYRSGNNVTNVTFDHCTIHTGRWGVRTARTFFLKFLHCVFDSHLASYTCRTDVKNQWPVLEGGVQKQVYGTYRTCEAQILSAGTSEDMEFDHCEFRNGHDAIQVYDIRTKIHDCLFENFNDEVLSFQYYNTATDVRVYNNVIRKALTTYSFSQQGSVPGARYIYRNIFDNRIPILDSRVFAPDVAPNGFPIWRVGGDFKMNAPVDVFYCYQNTFIQRLPDFAEESSVFDTCLTTNKKDRQFLNNIHLSIQSDKAYYKLPDPTFPALSNGNIWFRHLNNSLAATYTSYSGTSYATYAAMAATGLWPGWDANSLFVYPQFVDVADHVPNHNVPYMNSDYRLKSTSPARGAGVDLTAKGWPDTVAADSTPDIGAVPYGASAVAVGVDSRYVFPDGMSPIAEAGAYSTHTDTNNDGFESISLSSTGSSDPDGTINSYSWTHNGTTIGSSSTGSYSLPVGENRVLLTVTDNNGRQSTDERLVTIGGLDNIVRNPGFENGTADWNFTGATASSIVASPVHLGASALQSPSIASVDTIVKQAVPVTPGAAVSFSGWVSGSGFGPVQQYAKVSVQWLDSSGASISWAEGTAVQNTGYILKTRTATAPANAVTASLVLVVTKNSAPGTAWFDDLFFAITDNKLTNAHFERGSTNWLFGAGTPQYITDSNIARSASGVLKLPGHATAYSRCYQLVPVTVGLTYTISCWIKTDSFPAGKYAALRVEWANSSGAYLAHAGTSATVGGTSGGYTLVTFNLTVPASPSGIANMRIMPTIDAAAAPGVAYFDDIYVK